MEWESILGLVAVTLTVVGVFIFFGLKLSRAVQKNAPESDYAQSVTMTGNVLFAFVVGFWVICAAARELRPESLLGAFLGTADGVIAIFVASAFFIAIAGAILEKLGYPPMKRNEPNGRRRQ